jgi:hypothetical protein
MTHFMTRDRQVALGIDTDPRLDAVGADLSTQLARLEAVVAELAAPPVDRDPVLWAAHEFARCAQLLIGTRAPGDDAAADLGPALDHARSAMLSLTMARRHQAGAAGPRDLPPVG